MLARITFFRKTVIYSLKICPRVQPVYLQIMSTKFAGNLAIYNLKALFKGAESRDFWMSVFASGSIRATLGRFRVLQNIRGDIQI